LPYPPGSGAESDPSQGGGDDMNYERIQMAAFAVAVVILVAGFACMYH
jgi:hypothetical protein